MTSIIPSQCLACVHLDRSNTTPDGLVLPFQCAAYPERIPDDIMLFGDDHQEERGDEEDNLVFELAGDAEDMFEAWHEAFGDPASATPVLAHLPGQHDQKTHGRRGPKPDLPKIPSPPRKPAANGYVLTRPAD